MEFFFSWLCPSPLAVYSFAMDLQATGSKGGLDFFILSGYLALLLGVHCRRSGCHSSALLIENTLFSRSHCRCAVLYFTALFSPWVENSSKSGTKWPLMDHKLNWVMLIKEFPDKKFNAVLHWIFFSNQNKCDSCDNEVDFTGILDFVLVSTHGKIKVN